jgi:hypothetical protein
MTWPKFRTPLAGNIIRYDQPLQFSGTQWQEHCNIHETIPREEICHSEYVDTKKNTYTSPDLKSTIDCLRKQPWWAHDAAATPVASSPWLFQELAQSTADSPEHVDSYSSVTITRDPCLSVILHTCQTGGPFTHQLSCSNSSITIQNPVPSPLSVSLPALSWPFSWKFPSMAANSVYRYLAVLKLVKVLH